ncbi:MAG: heptosyltransferase II [archaeon GW2011_AR3]|nr:MAG: heptosyltransferase II [archaeon GW2011_AR3]MBS3109599.1 glycosyltransferase family 9 protein [Candidatus Woesearchaeota archaeon]
MKSASSGVDGEHSGQNNPGITINSSDGNGNLKGLFVNRDCRHFQDYKPCQPHKKFGVLCHGCPYYEPIKKRLLIVNLEAMGDVLRTTSILLPLREKYPGCHITWITTPKCVDILKNNPYVDRILMIGYETSMSMMIEEFDVAINVEKAHEACALFTMVKAKKKFGFELGKDGSIVPLSNGAKYFLDIGISDKHKRASRKTQQEIVFDIAGLEYTGQKSILMLEDSAKSFAGEFFKNNGLKKGDFIVGFNTGCSNRLFLDRKWSIDGFVELAKLLYSLYDAKILLLGGPNEIERNQEIINKSSVPIINTGNNNTIPQFAAIISKCSLLVTGDTLAVHMAAALDVAAVCMFGPTMPHEIELYGKGARILTDMSCAGCFKIKCEFHKTCMDRLQASTVFDAVEKVAMKHNLLPGRNMRLNAMAGSAKSDVNAD